MSDHSRQISAFDWRLTTFDGARREQLRRWAQLPLESLILALEEMEDLARQFGAIPIDTQSDRFQVFNDAPRQTDHERSSR